MIPTKTKIVAWYMRILSIVPVALGIIWVIEGRISKRCTTCTFITNILPVILYFIFAGLLLFFSYYLFKRKRWAWIGSTVFLLASGLLGIIGFYFIFMSFVWTMSPLDLRGEIFFLLALILFLSPLIAISCLLIDRKNYWKNV